ncbi:cell fusion protein aff-1 [Lepeophtheirus salmonis]|uniref:Uncharacterized protein n=1 Tax=Lepeophtheirus salmonis TaxID=72036 RepID=A0A0K2T583_LEPSM|nr:cell fusion protein aff-1-like [Lepeophtheirus salmonis]XP_040568878.1 cell fusion protein aff-1-like [Lepeophtheirus salmonis]
MFTTASFLLTIVLLVEGATFRKKGSLRCSNPLGSMDGRILVESQTGEISDFTTLQWQIRLGETVCYRFKSETPSGLKGYIEVTYESIRSIYSISNHYFFRLAKSNVQCYCDCPGGSNSCNTNTRSCEGKDNCINYYSSSVSSAGCFLKFLKISSSVCCSIGVERLEKDENKRYRAVELSVPSIIAELNVRHLNEDYSVVDSRTYHVDLNSGSSVDWEVSLQMSGAGPSNSVPPGWYMVPEMSHDLFGSIPINRLDEWNIYKLGWFKSKRDKDHIESTGHQLRRAFDVEMLNCMDNSYRTEFSTPYINDNQLTNAQRIESMFPFIQSVQVWRRTVEIVHRESPLLVLTLQHRNKVGVVMQYHESTLDNFEGYVLLDSHSNQFLCLNMSGARGSIRGTVSSQHSEQQLVISTTVKNNGSAQTSKRIKLRGGLLCDRNQKVMVILSPSDSNKKIKKLLPCLEDGLQDFDSYLSKVSSKSISTYRDCPNCSDSWKYWINPFSWGTNIWSTTRILLTTVTLVIILSLIIIVVRIMCCICRCSPNNTRK